MISLLRVCFAREGESLEKAEKEVGKLTAQPPPMDPTTPQVQLKHVVSQGSEEVVPNISSKDLTKHWDTFKSENGRDPRPEEEGTSDWPTGIDALKRRDSAPYVDLGIWGPSHHRLLGKLRNTGLQIHIRGGSRQVEIARPRDIYSFPECYHLLTTWSAMKSMGSTRTTVEACSYVWNGRQEIVCQVGLGVQCPRSPDMAHQRDECRVEKIRRQSLQHVSSCTKLSEREGKGKKGNGSIGLLCWKLCDSIGGRSAA